MSSVGEVCVFCERRDVALELLTAGRRVARGAPIVAVAAGCDGASQAQELVAHGADVVLVVDHAPECDPREHLMAALTRIVAQRSPDVVLLGATILGTELAARLAQRLRVGCASDCTDLSRRDDGLQVERNCLGRFVASLLIETRPAIATVQPRRFEPSAAAARNGRIDSLKVEPTPCDVRVVGTRPMPHSNVRIDRAEVIVAAGRGLRSREDLQMIEALAEALGGVVGASRPLTDDLRWLPPERKIGLSGLTVRPKLYVACGISGQVEHNVGIRESGTVVAINADPDAPIMQQADYCVTGDLYQVVPALIRSVGKIARG